MDSGGEELRRKKREICGLCDNVGKDVNFGWPILGPLNVFWASGVACTS